MPSEGRNNYFKLVALIVDIACNVIWTYIREKILGSSSFESFLSLEKHKLVHMHETLKCCECLSETIKGERLITRKQLLLLYEFDVAKQNQSHTKYAGRNMTQTCICSYHAVENIDVRVIDITLANYIIQKFGKKELGIDNWIEQIKDVRNEIVHLSDIQQLTDQKFNRKWTKLKDSILGIAKAINSVYAKETEEKIKDTKILTVVADYMLKYEILCCDYWEKKCADFEREQTLEVKQKAAILHYHTPVADCKGTMEKIQTLKTAVDNIDILIDIFGNEENKEKFAATQEVADDMQRIHIPVFLQVDVPTSWDKTKIFEAINEMRLTATDDMNIQIKAISRDDLKILAKIANQILHKVHELKSEVGEMMSSVLSDAGIVTTQQAKVVVNMNILDKSESLSFESSFLFDVDLRQRFKLKPSLQSIENSVITNSQLVFTDKYNRRLLIYDEDGNYNKTIPCKMYGKLCSLSVIKDNNVAVSYKDTDIQIININTDQVENVIIANGDVSCISYNNGLLYGVIDKQTIDVMNYSGETIQSFSSPSSSVGFLVVNKDCLFLTDVFTDTLYCCDLNGSIKWEFSDHKMQCPRGITIDEYGNIYVTGYVSHNVIVVSPDGKQHRELINKQNGLKNPIGIYYDYSKCRLLVCSNANDESFVYDIKQQ